jgi:hypothetical protein
MGCLDVSVGYPLFNFVIAVDGVAQAPQVLLYCQLLSDE